MKVSEEYFAPYIRRLEEIRARGQILEAELRLAELRYNHNHDNKGRFCSGKGSGGSCEQGVDKSSDKYIIKLQMNLFDKSDPIYIDAMSIEEEDGFEDVCLHGSPTSVQKKIDGKLKNMNAKEFADYLKDNGYDGGDIRLASCSTGKGENSFAQLLSKELGITVKAPDSDVYYIPEDGRLSVGSPFSNTGKWRIFKNGEEIT